MLLWDYSLEWGKSGGGGGGGGCKEPKSTNLIRDATA